MPVLSSPFTQQCYSTLSTGSGAPATTATRPGARQQRRKAGPSAPRPVLLPRPLQHAQVPAPSGVCTYTLIPRAASVVQPLTSTPPLAPTRGGPGTSRLHTQRAACPSGRACRDRPTAGAWSPPPPPRPRAPPPREKRGAVCPRYMWSVGELFFPSKSAVFCLFSESLFHFHVRHP
jgi:hypothetical protein